MILSTIISRQLMVKKFAFKIQEVIKCGFDIVIRGFRAIDYDQRKTWPN